MSNQKQQQIKLSDNIPGGEYANFMQASHTKEEFMMMFANIVGGNGRIVGKIITSPGHLKRIVKALQDNLKIYEDKFGEITEAQGPGGKEIGFKEDK